MARRWISYSVDHGQRRRRNRQWRWPWKMGRGPRYGRPHVVRIQPTRQRSLGSGKRRSVGLWLLLLLFLFILLFLGILAWLLLGGPKWSGSAELSNAGNQIGMAADPVPGGAFAKAE